MENICQYKANKNKITNIIYQIIDTVITNAQIVQLYEIYYNFKKADAAITNIIDNYKKFFDILQVIAMI